ncbi:aminotransferase class I/II-fold pyridoxal phosphate-dependent enzyme [Phormidium pseudopriestleyi FRX01]|uniref:Aminotransferase class I/II-fold pyridoxal phosphate-dependent enzyme n=1 Tax=Phormidium pseudopriestleyi FRX01 TaxID=1759528 RepID=A0ABS3FQ23_9CYAN|nr:aminotransferase class I/II-fold pyridoxal phosphate-dependent enzyme [Phormidium pseudopriestleyi]MBO0349216.1 aminotransferase class I/II-fold pyridoxal phosphate-dependent enzyme [Phormidium pseudopriestleyi FRX01]
MSQDHRQAPLLETLARCAKKPDAPFYAPGHKRGRGIPQSLSNLLGTSVFLADLPELPDLDNLFAPTGAIAAAQELAADAFGASQTWFLVNGSTAGIIAAILATIRPGDKIILPRNVHKSVISGLILSGALPVFISPEFEPVWGLALSITPASVAEALAVHPDAKAVMMVYPTYQGVCGDIQAIATVTHQFGIPLLVDEAHGPHFAFHEDLPTPALVAGADLSVQSIHKVLGAMTQASMLHIQGDRIDVDRLSQSLQLMQSTSPSYLLLASLDAARQQMALQGQELMTQTLALGSRAREEIAQIPGLSVLTPPEPRSPGFVAGDRTRLTVGVWGWGLSGYEVDEMLQELGVTCELPSPDHLTFIISLGNTSADIDQLVQGFSTLSHDYWHKQRSVCLHPMPPSPALSLCPRDAFFALVEAIPITEAIARVSAELVCPYPPGIPILMPGEVITLEAVAYLQQVLAHGGILTGCSDPTLTTLKVVRTR